jgi:hypothetical protein
MAKKPTRWRLRVSHGKRRYACRDVEVWTPPGGNFAQDSTGALPPFREPTNGNANPGLRRHCRSSVCFDAPASGKV